LHCSRQSPPSLRKRSRECPVTGSEKIADALRAGPVFVAKEARLLDWLSTPGGEYRILREGSIEWDLSPDEPACIDPVFLRWIQDIRVGRALRIDRIGIAYMYAALG
jgi:hypothetical protein